MEDAFINQKYLPPFTLRHLAIQVNKTFCISPKEGLLLQASVILGHPWATNLKVKTLRDAAKPSHIHYHYKEINNNLNSQLLHNSIHLASSKIVIRNN